MWRISHFVPLWIRSGWPAFRRKLRHRLAQLRERKRQLERLRAFLIVLRHGFQSRLVFAPLSVRVVVVLRVPIRPAVPAQSRLRERLVQRHSVFLRGRKPIHAPVPDAPHDITRLDHACGFPIHGQIQSGDGAEVDLRDPGSATRAVSPIHGSTLRAQPRRCPRLI